MLVLDPLNFRTLQLLHVEFAHLQTYRTNWAKLAQPLDPGRHIADATLQRWWEPARSSASIAETCFPVPGVPPSTRPSHGPTSVEGLLDSLPSVHEFCRDQHLTGLAVEQGNTGGFAARIQFEPERVKLGVLNTLLEHDGKGRALEDSRFARGEQEACAARMDRLDPYTCLMGHRSGWRWPRTPTYLISSVT